MQLFQYAVFYKPSEKDAKDGKKAEVIKDITSIVAADEKEVMIRAVREIPQERMDQIANIEVAVRPF